MGRIKNKQRVPLSLNDELERLQHLLHFENEAKNEGYFNIAGVDEAGRGPLAGPVVAAACVIPANCLIANINDSKKLTDLQREELDKKLRAHPDIIFGIGIVDHVEIDTINILNATIKAMRFALTQLSVQPDYLLVDGMSLDYNEVPSKKIIKGDSLSYSIAAASILAKVTRDCIMREYHESYPQYGFDRHKGYGTKAHFEAIKKYGPCPIHRLTFEPVRSLLSSS